MHNASELSSRFQEAVMRGISVRRRIFSASAAALAVGLLASGPRANAANIFTTDFEPSTYTSPYTFSSTSTYPTASGNEGGLYLDYNGTTSSTASIGTLTMAQAAQEGPSSDQVLQISHVAGSTIGVGPRTDVTVGAGSGGTTTISATVDIDPTTGTAVTGLATPTAANNGPFFGINLVGNNGASEIGLFGVDATTGDLVYSPGGSGTLTFFRQPGSTPAQVNGEGSDPYELTATFAPDGTIVLNAYLLDDADPTSPIFTFTSDATGVTSFDYTYLWSSGLTKDTAGSGYFDNLSVDSSFAPTSSVPEPTGLAVIGVCGVLLTSRRRMRGIAGV
jgi:hypothetical protein